jgi:hypothetical protein
MQFIGRANRPVVTKRWETSAKPSEIKEQA